MFVGGSVQSLKEPAGYDVVAGWANRAGDAGIACQGRSYNHAGPTIDGRGEFCGRYENQKRRCDLPLRIDPDNVPGIHMDGDICVVLRSDRVPRKAPTPTTAPSEKE